MTPKKTLSKKKNMKKEKKMRIREKERRIKIRGKNAFNNLLKK
jgi:hypothetical protein